MRYLIRRLLYAIPLIIGTMFVSFLVMQLAPGDPASMMIDPRMSTADIAQIRANMGLNQSIPIQFFHWANNVLHGNLGYSYTTGQPVSQIIGERLPATLLLSVSTLIVILIVTFPLGIISAAMAKKWPDTLITIVSFVGMSVPTFWTALMLILVFSVQLDWLPTSGMVDPSIDPANLLESMGSTLHHLILPVTANVIGSIAVLTRYYRFGMIKILKEPYILAAQARGISQRTILTRHAFKNAALPIITLLGLELPGLVGGAFVIETIFSWPGLGQLGVASAFSRDYPVLMGTLLMSSFLIVVGNLISDLTYTFVDPRIRRPR